MKKIASIILCIVMIVCSISLRTIAIDIDTEVDLNEPALSWQKQAASFAKFKVNAIRTGVGVKQALRFKYEIDDSVLIPNEEGYEAVEYGYLAALSENVDEALTLETENTFSASAYVKPYGEQTPTQDIVFERKENSRVVSVALYNIGYNKSMGTTDYTYYDKDYVVRSYIKFSNGDETITIYGDEYKASVFDTMYTIFSADSSNEQVANDQANIKSMLNANAEMLNAYVSKYPTDAETLGIKNEVASIGGDYETAITVPSDLPDTNSNELMYTNSVTPNGINYFYTKASWAKAIRSNAYSHSGDYSLKILSRNQNDSRIMLNGLKPYTQYAVSFYWLIPTVGDEETEYFTGMCAVPTPDDHTGENAPVFSNAMVGNDFLGGMTQKTMAVSNKWQRVSFNFNTASSEEIMLVYQYYSLVSGSEHHMYIDDFYVYEIPDQSKYLSVRVSAENGYAFKGCDSSVAKGTVATFSALPKVNTSEFLGWYDNEDKLVNDKISFSQVVDEKLILTAKFTDGVPVADNLSGSELTTALETDGYYETFFERSYKNNIYDIRLANVIRKIKNGEKVSIVGLGGSITQRALATRVENSYSYLVYNHLCEKFSEYAGNISYANAGIGATTSVLGIARLNEQVLNHNPDLVILDFTTNDQPQTCYKYSYEAIIRTLYEKNIAIISIMFGNINSNKLATGVYQKGANRFDSHIPSLAYYNVPTVDYYGTLWDYYLDTDEDLINEQGEPAQWKNLWGDYIHPNEAGHKLAANAINHLIDKVIDNLDNIGKTPVSVPDIPFYEGVNHFMGADMYDHANIDATGFLTKQSSGVTHVQFDNQDANTIYAWEPWQLKAGEYLEFTVPNCKSFTIMRIEGLEEYGAADIYLNGELVEQDGAINTTRTKNNGLNAMGYQYLGNGKDDITIRIESTEDTYNITKVLIAN